MKVTPADFFTKHSRWISCLWLLMASWAQGQNYQPAAVQQPVYRQGGSAYVPPGIKRTSTQQRLPAAPINPPGYQPGFGTPQNYRPPTVKGNTMAPPKTTAPASKSKPATLEHKVARLERNDALQDRRLNGLETGAGTPPRVVEGGNRTAAPEGKLYTVRTGDTLWRIADKHNTSVNALKSANRLPNEVIAVGQTLLIPGYGESAPLMSNPSAVGSYVVRPGDTFSQIARVHGVTQDALARANPSAYTDRLLVGEKLTIPGKKGAPASTPTSPAPASSLTANLSSRAHVVKKGESLGAIAKSYGIPTATLASANHLKNANLIEPGQKLIIPSGGGKTPAPAPVYVPTNSDTEPLADKLLTSTPAASSPPRISAPVFNPEPVSQPASKPTPTVSSNRRGIIAYRLERGDDISTVSALFNTSPEKIRELNKLPADKKLKEGDEVVVPALGAVSLN